MSGAGGNKSEGYYSKYLSFVSVYLISTMTATQDSQRVLCLHQSTFFILKTKLIRTDKRKEQLRDLN